MLPWVVPTTQWEAVSDPEALLRRLTADGLLLVTWPPAPSERTPTHCFKAGREYWIWQPEVGGVRFTADQPHLTLYPLTDTDRNTFNQLVSRSWLPAIYPIWQRQVLHASAVAASTSGDVVAFTGPSGAGKSTTAFGLGTRPGWTMVADDTLAFSCEPSPPGVAAHARARREPDRIALYPLRREARLRPATAEHFGKGDAIEIPFEWPSLALRLKIVYVLDGRADGAGETLFTPLKASESFPLLLAQAHAMTLQLKDHNQRLMRDYLALASDVIAFRFSYPKQFGSLDTVFDQLEAHARTHGVVWEPARVSA